MDGRETLEARLLGRGNVVLDVQCYFCVYVLHILYLVIVPMVLCSYFICSVGYRWCYAHVGYAVLCTYHIVRMMDIRHLCAYGVVRMLDMQCNVHRVLCTCCKCSIVYIWCCVHVVHVVLCTYRVLCMIVQAML